MPRVFVDYWEAGEFAVTLELALVEDGSFTLSESWSCYAGGTGYAAQGRWTEAGGVIALAVESSDLREYPVGTACSCATAGDVLELRGHKLRLRA